MKTGLRNLLFGVLGAAAAAFCAGDLVSASVNATIYNPPASSTGPSQVCEGLKCVNYDANCNNLGGNNNPSWANTNFVTGSSVICNGGASGGLQFRNGTAANPNGGDYVFWCPWPQIGSSTWYAVDPT